jgi:hypothetical protein
MQVEIKVLADAHCCNEGHHFCEAGHLSTYPAVMFYFSIVLHRRTVKGSRLQTIQDLADML